MVAAVPDTATRPHGYARYRLDGCRCYTCGYARSVYDENRNKAIAAGTWQPYADAQPVRDHLAALSKAGIGYKRAAALAGVSVTAVQQMLFGRRGNPPGPRIKRETAEALLEVRPTLARTAGHAVIDGTGTARRIQALTCAGWSLTAQASGIGWTVQNYTKLTGGSPVIAATARAVAGLYDELSMKPAPPSYSATRARNHAARHGWLPPLAWDDDTIDSPAAVPCLIPAVAGSDKAVDELTVQRFMAGWTEPIPAAVRDELIRRLTMSGYSVAATAAVVRLAPASVGKGRARLGLTGCSVVAA